MADKEKKDGIIARDHSVSIGGNVSGSNIVIGNNNTVSQRTINIAPLYEAIYKKLDADPTLKPQVKEDVQADLKDTQQELERPEPDESFLARRFRNIKRMAPDITEVAFETLKNPIGGVVEIIKRVAKRVAEDADAK